MNQFVSYPGAANADAGGTGVRGAHGTDLNTVMQQVLARHKSEIEQLNIIVRCENLPPVTVNESTLLQVISALVRSIVNLPAGTCRQYLYINCAQAAAAVPNPELLQIPTGYKVQFHTNIGATPEWQMTHEKSWEACTALLNAEGGNLVINDIKNTGCIFSLFLPGKFNS